MALELRMKDAKELGGEELEEVFHPGRGNSKSYEQKGNR